MSLIRGTFLYYLILLIGMGLLGVYFWFILTATNLDITIKVIFYLSGIIVVGSTFSLAKAASKSSRIGLTMASGLVGGIHGFLVITLFPTDFLGTFLFFWLACGILLSYAALAWLPETD